MADEPEKPVQGQATPPVDPKPEPSKDQMVTISAADLKALTDGTKEALELVKDYKSELGVLQEEMKNLRSGGLMNPDVPANILKRITERYITVRTWHNKYIIGFADKSTEPGIQSFVYAVRDPQDPKTFINYVDLRLLNPDGSESIETVRYTDYVNDTRGRIKMKVKRVNEKPRTAQSGDQKYIEKAELRDYQYLATGVVVENIVEFVDRTYTVDLEKIGGEYGFEYTFDENSINH